MLIGQQVAQVLAVEEVAHHHLVIAVEYQNHAAAVLNLADALSAKAF
jgi:hypothetical protein